MPDQLCALIEGRLEKITGEFLLASFIGALRALTPHIGDENDVPQRRFTAKFTEQAEVPSGDPRKSIVGDAVDIDDPGEDSPFPVSVDEFSPEY